MSIELKRSSVVLLDSTVYFKFDEVLSNLNVSLDFVSGNIDILGKQNSLFPSGPVIKC